MMLINNTIETKKKLVEKDTEIQALKAKLLSMKPLNPERQEYIVSIKLNIADIMFVSCE